MNELKIYQVDAFTKKIFGGNPAAVIPLTLWLPNEMLQKIAMENNLSETVFIVPSQTCDYHIRWFTPSIEVRLCGHATLATAHVLWEHLNFSKETLTLESLSGVLKVERTGTGYTLDFPRDKYREENSAKEIVEKILGMKPLYLYRGKDDYMAVMGSEREIRELNPDFRAMKKLTARGLIVTAVGNDIDFVSRCFFPEAGIEEDPVTGSAHTMMAPYWASKIDRDVLIAQQLSKRKGDLICEVKEDRVLISGDAKTFMIGTIFLD
jgi:PhzF family phenazine biosynthesis protein